MSHASALRTRLPVFQPDISRIRRLSRVVLVCLLGTSLSGCLSTVDDVSLSAADVTPRLQNGEPERNGPVVNAAAFNADQAAGALAPFAGFAGKVRVDFPGDKAQVQSDVRDIRSAAGAGFDPNGMVTVDFTDATLAFVLQQLLGGALGVNYVAPDDLGGRVNFRTETPVPKSRILQVVRDILARNNLVIRFINGVYHIGTSDVIDALEVNAARGRKADEDSRIVKLDRSNAAEVARLATQLLPPSVTVVPSSAPDTLVVRSDPNDADSVEDLLRTLSSTAVGDAQVAIIPLAQSAPEAVAQGLTQFYQATIRGEEPPVTIIPLQNQQAILVGTSDPELMAGVQQLARQLDRSVTDISSLRVIPLTHIQANDIAPQLSQIFGSSGSAAAPEAPSSTGLGGIEGERLGGVGRNSRSRLLPRPPVSTIRPAAGDDEDGTGLAIPGPAGVVVAPPAATGGGAAGGGEEDSGAPAPAAAVQQSAAPQPGETRIVPDTRTNTLLVYSTYSVYKRMRDVVQTLDVAQAQVVIEATVLEVTLSDALDSGVQFFLEGNGFVAGSGVPSDSDSPRRGGIIGVGADLGAFSVEAVLSALRSVTNVKVVSSPYLTVIDGKSARLVIGDQIPFASRSQTANNLGNVTVTQEVDILDTGVVLEITPRIHANNAVDLQVSQSVSTPRQATAGNELTPTISTRDIQSQILVQSGRTVLLGGLIRDRVEKTEDAVPKISRVPVIGNLFKQQTSTAERTELVVLITPRVVRTSSEIENITRIIRSSQIGAGEVVRGPVVTKP